MGVCAREKKAKSKHMEAITSRLNPSKFEVPSPTRRSSVCDTTPLSTRVAIVSLIGGLSRLDGESDGTNPLDLRIMPFTGRPGRPVQHGTSSTTV